MQNLSSATSHANTARSNRAESFLPSHLNARTRIVGKKSLQQRQILESGICSLYAAIYIYTFGSRSSCLCSKEGVALAIVLLGTADRLHFSKRQAPPDRFLNIYVRERELGNVWIYSERRNVSFFRNVYIRSIAVFFDGILRRENAIDRRTL